MIKKLVVFYFLNVLDLLTTHLCISNDYVELNPFFNSLPPNISYALKLFLPLVFVVVIIKYYNTYTRFRQVTAACINVVLLIYFVTVLNNFLVLVGFNTTYMFYIYLTLLTYLLYLLSRMLKLAIASLQDRKEQTTTT